MVIKVFRIDHNFAEYKRIKDDLYNQEVSYINKIETCELENASYKVKCTS